MFFEQQISLLQWLLKDHVTEDWSNDVEKSDLHQKKILTQKIIFIILYIYNIIEFQNITDFTVLLIK